MNLARVFEHSQNAEPQQPTRGFNSRHLVLQQPQPALSPLHGLMIAGLLSAAFWGALALLIVALR
jgi:hypothetical protein